LRATAPVKEPFSWPNSSLSAGSRTAPRSAPDDGLVLARRLVVAAPGR
jgi:hypothetical protein